MPGDFNRVILSGLVLNDPLVAGKGTRLKLRTEQNWLDKGGVPRNKILDVDILVMHPSLVTFSSLMRAGDKILVEGTLERETTVVLGWLHSSILLLQRASDRVEP